MSEYNYASFPLDMSADEFGAFADLNRAGRKAPDGELVDASDGSRVRLSDFWSKGPLMIEFGSIT